MLWKLNLNHNCLVRIFFYDVFKKVIARELYIFYDETSRLSVNLQKCFTSPHRISF